MTAPLRFLAMVLPFLLAETVALFVGAAATLSDDPDRAWTDPIRAIALIQIFMLIPIATVACIIGSRIAVRVALICVAVLLAQAVFATALFAWHLSDTTLGQLLADLVIVAIPGIVLAIPALLLWWGLRRRGPEPEDPINEAVPLDEEIAEEP